MGKQLTIDIENQSLRVIDDCQLLRSNNTLQLISWGFKRCEGSHAYEIKSIEIDKILHRLVQHLKKKQIPYILTPTGEHALKIILSQNRTFQEIRNKAANFKDGNFSPADFNDFINFVSKNVVRQLKEHQIKASYHQYILGNNANFSVPGSGKTTTVLTNYQKLKLEDKVNILFVIGPPACFGPWKKEFELTLGYKPKVKILSGHTKSSRKFVYLASEAKEEELFLISYHAAFNDQNEIREFFGRKDIKPMLVIDEAHYLKQVGGNWSKAILSFSRYANYKCVLTGTPMPKSYTDMFNLFEFLWPEQNVIDNERKIFIQNFEKNNDISAAKETMRDCIGPLFYRVRKSDLGLLEQNFNPPVIVPMKEYERLIYDAIFTRIKHYAKDDYLRNIEIVDRLRKSRIMRLRQCVSYPKLLLTAIDGYEENLIDDNSTILRIIRDYDMLERPAKCDSLISSIKELKAKNEKVIVWANFVKTLKKLCKEIRIEGIACKLIYGETPIVNSSIEDEETREEIINDFLDQNSGLDVLLANPAACAESISLHKSCHNAVYYDLSYNCAQYLQSLDRIHRVGGSETILANYYFLQYEDTIDFDIKNNLDLKAQKMMDFIEEDYVVYSLDMFEEDNGDLEAHERLFGEAND